MKVDEMGWGKWHAWEITAYIVWWEHLKERDYLGNLCVYRQIILKLIWKKWGDGRVGRGLSGLDTSGIRGSGSEHLAFSISVLYTDERLALCSSRITPWETASCIHWLGHSCPGDKHGRHSSVD
jgi:hypothetical protein